MFILHLDLVNEIYKERLQEAERSRQVALANKARGSSKLAALPKRVFAYVGRRIGPSPSSRPLIEETMPPSQINAEQSCTCAA